MGRETRRKYQQNPLLNSWLLGHTFICDPCCLTNNWKFEQSLPKMYVEIIFTFRIVSQWWAFRRHFTGFTNTMNTQIECYFDLAFYFDIEFKALNISRSLSQLQRFHKNEVMEKIFSFFNKTKRKQTEQQTKNNWRKQQR